MVYLTANMWLGVRIDRWYYFISNNRHLQQKDGWVLVWMPIQLHHEHLPKKKKKKHSICTKGTIHLKIFCKSWIFGEKRVAIFKEKILFVLKMINVTGF